MKHTVLVSACFEVLPLVPAAKNCLRRASSRRQRLGIAPSRAFQRGRESQPDQ